ncbi:MAG: Co2+/Mg2+ efflux protein ApaG [Flavobacteriales bacterium]|nr:Co2+/Mg2+ efflux protein ApaG [Flavobacteriales bacterium]
MRTRFEPGISNPLRNNYMYSYTILIENNNDFPVQLMRRHWTIIDANGHNRQVEGPGVIGIQPVILPGASHTYSSTTSLPTLKGVMYGTYLMKKLDYSQEFRVRIPEFKLRVPYQLN